MHVLDLLKSLPSEGVNFRVWASTGGIADFINQQGVDEYTPIRDKLQHFSRFEHVPQSNIDDVVMAMEVIGAITHGPNIIFIDDLLPHIGMINDKAMPAYLAYVDRWSDRVTKDNILSNVDLLHESAIPFCFNHFDMRVDDIDLHRILEQHKGDATLEFFINFIDREGNPLLAKDFENHLVQAILDGNKPRVKRLLRHVDKRGGRIDLNNALIHFDGRRDEIDYRILKAIIKELQQRQHH